MLRNHLHKLRNVLLIATPAVSMLGCVHHQPMWIEATDLDTQARGQNPGSMVSLTASREGVTQGQSDPSQILSELLVLCIGSIDTHALEQQKPQSSGPQLVAGDWLAWQCAIAGGYWDNPHPASPVYAEAIESDLSEQ